VPAPARKSAAAPLVLVWGDDDFAVQQRARQLFRDWCQEAGGMDHETIDAGAANGGEALRALAKLREALQTLPFFGSRKVIWFQGCTFLGDDRTAGSTAVTAALGEFAQELKAFRWDGVQLLLSAGKVDKRRVFYKTVESLGQVEEHAGLSFEDKDWEAQAERYVQRELAARGKQMAPDVLGRFVAAVGPHLRQLSNEVEKLALFAGDRAALTDDDVARLVAQGKHARAFGLGEALGDRDLPGALHALDDELWEIRLKVDRNKSHVGLLYGLISKVRTLLLLKEVIRLGHLRADQEYRGLKEQLAPLGDLLPADKRYNPAAMHPFVVFKTLAQTANYSARELVAAMDVLLTCNQRLVGSSLDNDLLLQQALIQIVGQSKPRRTTPRERT
jgi:DNA polymerase III subunit delta